ncbi:MAG TPA: hypothetical protein VIL34_21805 [Actinopolymorphaceae bacterium]
MRDPRRADLAYLIWGTGHLLPSRHTNQGWIAAVVDAYRHMSS